LSERTNLKKEDVPYLTNGFLSSLVQSRVENERTVYELTDEGRALTYGKFLVSNPLKRLI
jgi:hypothetical protein